MHGLGNDYVIIDNSSGKIDVSEMGRLARQMCRRRFSIGADGALFAVDSDESDVGMRMFNPDGSEAGMCGNGIRCFTRYCYDKGLVEKREMEIETSAGVKKVRLENGSVSVDMGTPIWDRRSIPMVGEGTFIDEEIEVGGERIRATCLSVGNPHCVTFVDDLEDAPVEELGPALEEHELFTNNTNVEFVESVDDRRIRVRVWERSVGETLACGTGACAGAAAASRLGRCGDDVKVELRGGELFIDLADRITMKGSAEKVFEGEYIEVDEDGIC